MASAATPTSTTTASAPLQEAVLYEFPSLFKLPTPSPEGLAVEALLRFRRLSFRKVKSTRKLREWVAPLSDTATACPLLSVAIESETTKPSTKNSSSSAAGLASPKTTQAQSLQSVLDLLKRSNHNLDDGLSDQQLARSALVRSFVLQELFPRLWSGLLRDPTCAQALCNSISTRSWIPLFDSQTTQVGEAKTALCQWYHILCEAGGETTLRDELVEKFMVLERMLSTTTTVKRDLTDIPFFLGGTAPTVVDGFVFGACSVLLHGEFPGSNVLLQTAQILLRQRCPLLLQYTEMVKAMYFAVYSGYYTLKGIPSPQELKDSAEEAVFRKGRFPLLVGTAAFATLYFVVANAEVILNLIRIFETGEVEDSSAEGEAEEAPAPAEGAAQ